MKIFAVFMTVVVAYLLYRTFDLGVTVTYLEQQLNDFSAEIETVARFQRTPCDSLVSLESEVQVIRKDGQISIDGWPFRCVETPDAGGLLMYAGRQKVSGRA